MPEVQGSVKQIDLSSESADPGDSFKNVFTNTESKYSSVYSTEKIEKINKSQVDNLPFTTLKQLEDEIEKKTKINFTKIISSFVNPSNDKVNVEKKSNETQVNSKKLNRIITSSNKPYLYIAQGDFSIVWPNVIVFSLASILYLVAAYTVIITRDVTLYKTWMCCKSFPFNPFSFFLSSKQKVFQ